MRPLRDRLVDAASDGSLKERAYRTLKRMILTGELRGGSQVVEAELSKKLKISRTPIRESILQLEHEGLLRVVPYKGIFVAEMSLNDMKDLLQLRFWLERFAVQEAVSLITDADLTDMKSLVDQQEQAFREGDLYQFMELDRQFHLRIAQVVGNARLLRILDNLRDQLVACGLRGLQKRERIAEVLTEHREVIRGLELRDGGAATAAMDQHLLKVRDSVLNF
ncbi:MAG: GntR family transcriptional regulator [Bacillota bacterium]|nr:GntR family transcriptional regulator [Bacillota bacterium]